jgi:5-methylcytosine-specific restriction enzyme A
VPSALLSLFETAFFGLLMLATNFVSLLVVAIGTLAWLLVRVIGRAIGLGVVLLGFAWLAVFALGMIALGGVVGYSVGYVFFGDSVVLGAIGAVLGGLSAAGWLGPEVFAPEASPIETRPSGVRAPIPVRTRAIVFARDGLRCRRCGSIHNLEIDHVHPFARGGSDDLSNLQTLCRGCNRRKGARYIG